MNMFDFDQSGVSRKLILDPASGAVVADGDDDQD